MKKRKRRKKRKRSEFSWHGSGMESSFGFLRGEAQLQHVSAALIYNVRDVGYRGKGHPEINMLCNLISMEAAIHNTLTLSQRASVCG